MLQEQFSICTRFFRYNHIGTSSLYPLELNINWQRNKLLSLIIISPSIEVNANWRIYSYFGRTSAEENLFLLSNNSQKVHAEIQLNLNQYFCYSAYFLLFFFPMPKYEQTVSYPDRPCAARMFRMILIWLWLAAVIFTERADNSLSLGCIYTSDLISPVNVKCSSNIKISVPLATVIAKWWSMIVTASFWGACNFSQQYIMSIENV